MSVQKVLKNGVVMHSLEVENDFSEAKNIFQYADILDDISVYLAFEKRVDNTFCGTYQISIERDSDFKRFSGLIDSEKMSHSYDKRQNYKNKLRSLYNRGLYESYSHYDRAFDKTYEMDFKCECKKCSFRTPSFEEWKTGVYNESEKRIIKLGRKLLKVGFEQSLIDFYSLQNKVEKVVYLTISDRVQHIAGMSFYAEIDEWDGYNGTSCQDTRHNGDYCLNLAGSLHDDKLFVAMLHSSIEDLKDMTDKLLARVLLRYVSIDEIPALIATTYYGNNDTKNELHHALSQLVEVNIFNKDIRQGDTQTILESANGSFKHMITDTITVCETIEDEVSCSCPMCLGTGEYEVYSDLLERHFEVTCPACQGDGTVWSSVYIDIDEEIEVTREQPIRPYVEGYTHNGNRVLIDVNLSKVREMRERV